MGKFLSIEIRTTLLDLEPTTGRVLQITVRIGLHCIGLDWMGLPMVSSTSPIDEYDHPNFSRKRLKVSDLSADFASSNRGDEQSATEMSCQSNGNSSGISQSCNGGGSSCDKSYSSYAPSSSSYVSGWMYVNEHGQMCGPYIQQQLYEGLSTGFLPDELPVYPVVNGALINPVPLKYFRQFPDHVATGFIYLTSPTASNYLKSSFTNVQHTPSPSPSQFNCNVKMNVGCLKMMRVGNMGPILFYNCIPGIAVGILQIPL